MDLRRRIFAKDKREVKKDASPGVRSAMAFLPSLFSKNKTPPISPNLTRSAPDAISRPKSNVSTQNNSPEIQPESLIAPNILNNNPQVPFQEIPPKKEDKTLKEYFWEMHVRWNAIVTHPTAVILLESIFFQPAYLCFFAVLTTYILGHFHFSYFWCLFIACGVNFAASKIIQRMKNSAIRKERLHGSKHRQEMYPDKESAVWVNNIIIAVISNHHAYISNILLHFINPVLKRFLVIPPVESIEFREFDLGTNPPRISNCAVKLDTHRPPKSLKYDFDVELATNMRGVLHFILPIIPEISIVVSNLLFKSRMRIEVEFVPQKFPFISTCRLAVLEEPEIDISVEMAGLPDFLIFPFVTDHYLKVIRRFLYQQFGSPNCLEIDLTVFLQDHGDAGECFVADVQSVIPEIIRHERKTEFVPSPILDSPKRKSALSRAVHRINKKSKSKRTKDNDITQSCDGVNLQKNNLLSPSRGQEFLTSSFPGKPVRKVESDTVIAKKDFNILTTPPATATPNNNFRARRTDRTLDTIIPKKREIGTISEG